MYPWWSFVHNPMLPSVTKAKYVRDYLVEVKFNDGTKKVIDLESWLTGPIFRPLRSKTYFKKFFVDGPTIAWPNGAVGFHIVMNREEQFFS